jgi:hypothetical protein
MYKYTQIQMTFCKIQHFFERLFVSRNIFSADFRAIKRQMNSLFLMPNPKQGMLLF